MPSHDDAVRLKHMLDYTREAIALSQSRTRTDLDSDRLFNLAMTRLVEIIGESAAQISAATQQAHPHVPWAQIIAVRNRLIHGYDQINFDILWDILELDLPPLAIQLEALVKQHDSPA